MPNDTADLSRVLSLSRTGFDLSMKGHSARAAEKYALAAEEAEETLPVPDCLIACRLRQSQLHALLVYATCSAVEPPDVDDALREVILRLPSLMAVLDRRKAAGTLLPGSCRPVEEAYQTAAKWQELKLEGNTPASAAVEAVVAAPFVGVETYMCVATFVGVILNNAGVSDECLVVLSDEQTLAGYLFVASAVDLMALPRNFDTWLTGEPGFVKQLRILIPAVRGVDKPATKKLCAAWRRVLRSGVLRQRGINDGIDAVNQENERICAATKAEVEAGQLQQCALAGCAASESHASQFKKCGACRAVVYCCREHQVEDWPAHKTACKAARKAAADPAGA
jgi:hypothetical protein